jgi:hypothetical protein
MTRLRTLAVLAATTLSISLLPSAASADTAWFREARGDVKSSNDIVRYKVLNTKRIGVRTVHRNLRASAQDIQLLLDTNAKRKGYEWGAYATLDGSFASVWRDTRSGPEYHDCPGLRVSRSVREDWAVLTVPRACVGRPDAVRLRTRVQWSLDGSQGDWAPGARRWSDWVRR